MTKMTPLQEFVFYRTYSRWNDSLARRETWEEAVDRYLSYFKNKFSAKVPKKVWEKARESILAMKVMPSMRAFWTAGPALDATHVAGYNCCYLAFKDLFSPCELFYVLMCGTGAGFSVESEFVNKMPEVSRQTGVGIGVYVVEDDKEGWANSLFDGLKAWFEGKDLEFDYSKIRARGSRLKTMGGRASGPDPLKDLHRTVRGIVMNAQGRQLTSLEWLDIGNKIAEVVVVGGVRRSSEITFSDLSDESIRHAKDFSRGSFPAHRYMSNNSAVYNGTPDMVTFMKEWTALAASGSGERGIFNAKTALLGAPRRKDVGHFRTNPCVPGNTEILTPAGYFPIQSLVGKQIEIWNGFEWSKTTPRVTGYNQEMVRVTLTSGQELTCTKAHVFHIQPGYYGESIKVEAKDLKPGMKLIKTKMPVVYEGLDVDDAYTQGFISGDGMDGYNCLWLYKPKYMCEKRLNGKSSSEYDGIRKQVKLAKAYEPKNFVPMNWNVQSRLDWLAGLLDSDGTELKEGGAQISSIDKEFLLKTQKMLTTLGVTSKVTKNKDAGMKLMPDGQDGQKEYFCQEIYRLLIGAVQMQDLKQLGLKCERMLFDKKPQRDASQFVKVASVEDAGIEETVYCFTEPKRNLGCFEGVVTGQCGEILLRDSEFCNLSEVVVRKNDTFNDLCEKVKTAVWLGAMQSCLTDFPYIRAAFKENCEEERLLGVSLTGQMDAPKLMTETRLSDLKDVAIAECKKACRALGIPMSAAISTGKPSGTVSQLVDAASGAHPRFAKYYIRRVRISANDPLCRMLRAQGVEMSPENDQGPESVERKRKEFMEKYGHDKDTVKMIVPDWSEDSVNTWVVSFPEKAPDGAITKDDVSAIEQLEWYKKLRTNWCEHNQSITVYVKENEWLEVGNWVYQNFDIVSGVSFLPFDGGKYQQAPYEEITEKVFNEMKKRFPEIDYSQLSKFEQEDNTSGAQALACSAGGCELP